MEPALPSRDRVRAERAARRQAALTDIDCQSYARGHGVHWIPALRSSNGPAQDSHWTGSIIGLAADGLTLRRQDGSEVRYLNHHMARLIALCGGVGSEVRVHDGYGLLRTPSPDGSYCFNIVLDTGTPLAPCIRSSAVRS